MPLSAKARVKARVKVGEMAGTEAKSEGGDGCGDEAKSSAKRASSAKDDNNAEDASSAKDDKNTEYAENIKDYTGRDAGPIPHNVGVYVIANLDNKRTYVGCAWTSFHHRLRQHNREIKGGAAATAVARNWHHRLLVTGFTSRKKALSFEWYVKRYRVDRSTRSRASVRDPVARRRLQIEMLLNKFGSTQFPGLTLHAFDSGAPSCHCFDCCNKMRRNAPRTTKHAPRAHQAGPEHPEHPAHPDYRAPPVTLGRQLHHLAEVHGGGGAETAEPIELAELAEAGGGGSRRRFNAPAPSAAPAPAALFRKNSALIVGSTHAALS